MFERYSFGTELTLHTDTALRDRTGIVVAFSERGGGVSKPPFDTLNLAAHVGDDPDAVDRNRTLLLDALGLSPSRDVLVTAEQVHGTTVSEVGRIDAGAGAWAGRDVPSVRGADALYTAEAYLPLMLFFADCVPVILVTEQPIPAIAVAHAGWRGALGGIVGKTASLLAARAGSPVTELSIFIGPHIGSCCYEVDNDLLSHFRDRFGTICAVGERLDLCAAIVEDLRCIGVSADQITTFGSCTTDHVDRFFSYRACQVTGRHGALAAITKGE